MRRRRSTKGEMPLDMVLKVGSVHAGGHAEVRTAFEGEGPARAEAQR